MSPKLTISSTLPLPNSEHSIPQIGFGVYLSPPSTCVSSCTKALEAGYRHIDTAIYYENEEAVHRSLVHSALRNLPNHQDPFARERYRFYVQDDPRKRAQAGRAGRRGLRRFVSDSQPQWRQGESEVDVACAGEGEGAGRVRDIGVSNYDVEHIEEIKEFGKVWPPAVNQIELHPWCQQRRTVQYCTTTHITIEAYCPLVRNLKASDKTLLAIAEKHAKSTNQILIRYCLQKGWVPLPKSDHPERIASNADVYGFELDEEDVRGLDGLDEGRRGAIVQAVDVEV